MIVANLPDAAVAVAHDSRSLRAEEAPAAALPGAEKREVLIIIHGRHRRMAGCQTGDTLD